MKQNILFIALILTFMGACTSKQKVDTIVINAKVYTLDSTSSITESFAIKDGYFVAVGSNKEIGDLYESDQIIDLTGKFVYPGFNDAHCHFYGYGLNLQNADLVGTKSFSEILNRLQGHSENYETSWIVGRGWDQNDWELKEYPTNEKLNELFPDKPVYLTRIDGHAAIVNKKALELAGITAETSIAGGEFIQQNGVLTGVLIDNAMELVRKHIPEPSNNEKVQAFINAQANCFEVGLTSLSDAGLDKNVLLLMDSLNQSNDLKMRVNAWLADNVENMDYFVKNGMFKTNYLHIGTIKLYADGALGSRGAKMIEPYSDDPNNTGLIVTSPAHLREICQFAYDHDFQVATHAIGDSANRLMLHIYGEVLKGKNDRRWRIEHSQIVNPSDFELFEKYSIIPSIQSTHATSDMYWAQDRVGEERIKGSYAYQTLLQQNGWLPNGTDFPIEHINPLYGFYAFVTRQDHQQFPEGGFMPENALTKEQALRAMTIWPAMAAMEENKKGSIEAKKFADFVVFDQDFMEIDTKEVLNLKVQATYSAGVEVYSYKF